MPDISHLSHKRFVVEIINFDLGYNIIQVCIWQHVRDVCINYHGTKTYA